MLTENKAGPLPATVFEPASLSMAMSVPLSSSASRKRPRVIPMRVVTVILALLPSTASFSCKSRTPTTTRTPSFTRRNMSSDWSDSDNNSNEWGSSSDSNSWSTFESSEEEGLSIDTEPSVESDDLLDASEAWLDTIAALSAEEIKFNQKDNERADKARQMQEWGFDEEMIKNTFDVALDDSKETVDDPIGLKEYRQDMYEEDPYEEYEDIESHTRVEVDPETGEPIRQQMVYVDEHSCIGCTNCATIAQSTFFMESWHGRARVFKQWGDTEDTIAMAIETCPVDCIHYVDYPELEALEIERRDQKINNAARLVNQGESAHMAGVAGGGFSMPQKISSNAKARCNNCPSNGCKNCPMFGVGKNPEYEKREQQRKARLERRRLERERADNNKSMDL